MNTLHKGFTLLEVSVVLLVVGLMLGMILKPLGASFEQSKRRQAKVQLQQIYDASIGFAQSKSRLPCPATEASAPLESSHCLSGHGYVPAATLGVQGNFNTKGQLLDPWSQPLRYSVSLADSSTHGNVGVPDFVSTGEMQAVGLSELHSDYVICAKKSSHNCPADKIRANQVPLVIYSTGKEFSSILDSIENQDNDNVFISRAYSSQASSRYDDLVIWLSENILFTKLISAGVLP